QLAADQGDVSFSPAGLRFGPDGNLYVALNGGSSATSGGAVIRFDINNTGGTLSYAGTATPIATGLVQPTQMTFRTSPSDKKSLYVSTPAAGSVVKIDDVTAASPSSSTFIAAGTGNIGYPAGITFGPDGKLYVVDLGANTHIGKVVRFNADGSFDKVFTQP